MPVLTSVQAEIVRRLCAETGIDDYAAAVMVADVGERSRQSPHWDTVSPVIREMLAEAGEPFHRWLDAKGEEYRRAMLAFGEALITAWAPVLRSLAKSCHDLSAAMDPRGHRRHCVACYPRGNPRPLKAGGHEYSRRRKARQRRKSR
jgi:hypothetical protein